MWSVQQILRRINTLKPRQNGLHLPDDIFKCIFLNENVWISLNISLKFVPKVPINNIPALVLIMAWRRPGDKPLSEPVMVSLPTHICVTRPQWVKDQTRHRWLCYCLFWHREVDSWHFKTKLFNSLCRGDAILRHRSGSKWAQIIAYCLMTPIHCMNQCWLVIDKVWRRGGGQKKVIPREIPQPLMDKINVKIISYGGQIVNTLPGLQWKFICICPR